MRQLLLAKRARGWLGRSHAIVLVRLGVARVLVALTGGARWQIRVGRLRERLGRQEDAAVAYLDAVARPGCQLDWVRHRVADDLQRGQPVAAEALADAGLQRFEHDQVLQGALVSALTAQERWTEAADVLTSGSGGAALDTKTTLRLGEGLLVAHEREQARRVYETVANDGRGASVRLALARLYDESGHWNAARRHLQRHLGEQPQDAAAHRMLARIGRQIWLWNGWFEGSVENLDELTFRSGTSLPDDAGHEVSALDVARHALERAVALALDKPAWRGALGELQEASGDLDAAIDSYAAAVDAIAASNRRTAFKTRHQWEFALQRARHAAGRGEVDDPLLDCSWRPEGEVDPGEQPAGMFRVVDNFAGLGVLGVVPRHDVAAVEVWLDDLLLREVNLSRATFLPGFGLSITRPALDVLPARGKLRVRTRGGEELLAGGRAQAYRLRVPHGDGAIAGEVDRGPRLDKKGAPVRASPEVSEVQDAYLRLYARVREDMERLAGVPLLLLYGTLLGCHRDDALIPGDDDFDVGYVSAAGSPAEVKREAQQLMLALVRNGYTVSFNRSGRLFRVAAGREATALHLDVHPIWFEDDGAWLHNHAHFSASVGDFLPPRERKLQGTAVLLPRHPEVFLAANYGPGWTSPDPGFVHDPGDVDERIRSHLAKALITPAEHEELVATVEAERARKPGMGRLVSVGSQPLYPLEDFVP